MVKAKLQLVMILSGLVFLDLSCDNPGSCKDVGYGVEGVRDILLKEFNSEHKTFPLSNDTIAYDSIVFEVVFDQKLLSSTYDFSLINIAYATPACKPVHTVWNLDSIKIFSISGTFETEVTSSFTLYYGTKTKLDTSNIELRHMLNRSTGNFPLKMQFLVNTIPLSQKSAQYKFQFFDTKGRVFSKTSEAVVITP